MPAARGDPHDLLEDFAHVRSDVDATRVNGQDESKQELQMVVVAEIAPRAPRAEQTLEPSRLGHQTESGNGFLAPPPHGAHYPPRPPADPRAAVRNEAGAALRSSGRRAGES